MWNSETNQALPGSTVTIGGIDYTAPVVKSFVKGTVLTMLVNKTDYALENRTITALDTSITLTQQLNFLLSALLVSLLS